MNAPFSAFRSLVPERSALRQAITDNTRAAETERVALLSEQAVLTPDQAGRPMKQPDNWSRHCAAKARPVSCRD